MIARIRKSMDDKEKGFTLIELLVVMIIIGILAAIAIPVFLSQRKKAQDTAAVSDVSTIGKEISTYYVDADAVLAATAVTGADPGRYTVNGTDAGKVSTGVSGVALTYPTGVGTDVTSNSRNWCVTLSYTGGTKGKVIYSAQNGLDKTTAAVCPVNVP